MEQHCKRCGGQVAAGDRYCIHCGSPLEREAQDVPQAESRLAEPLRVGEYLLIGILLMIPVVNLILCILWCLDKAGNPNRRNLAKAWLILIVLETMLTAALLAALAFAAARGIPPVPYPVTEYRTEEVWETPHEMPPISEGFALPEEI